ncbi:hypothetical protein [Marinobacterium lutimaris]|uniref:Uncharacterized protein n=1 Tax=Marinobacterium lutimaris TaxID=568106 RepID=A0A1H5XXN3_9GAMM|nr:hypothetical protein [Marinobacterium lutimaris]SEG16403.1 hypothetical protein SAMN05444390_1011539 [Marinobacterium lutimaris]
MENAKFIEVSAAVRYWDDALVNGKEDTDGSLIPFTNGDLWEPVIDLEAGKIQSWPQGTEADIHYKVCDAGEYWLLDADKKRIAKWLSDYVPNKYLCHGDNGYGDYIILKVTEDGNIEDFEKPDFHADEWDLDA